MTPKEIEPRFSVLLGAYSKEIDSSYFCPRGNVLYDRTILGLVSKGISLGRAICHLVQDGFYGEALGVSRSSIECFLLVKYISNKEQEKRATEYLDFFKAHLYNVEQIRKTYFSKSKAPSGQIKRWIKEAEVFPNKRCWMPAHNMAMEKYEDPLEANRKTGKLYQASFDYDGLYEKTSHWVHCGSVSLQGHIKRGGESFKVFDRAGDDELNGYLALQYGMSYVLMTCIISFCHFNKTVPVKLQVKTFSLLREVAGHLPEHRLIYGRLRSDKFGRRWKKPVAKKKK